jgi:hypothetical protein
VIWVLPLQGEEAVGGGDERGVVIPAEVGAPLVVVEAEFALELFVVELDLPAQPRQARKLLGLGRSLSSRLRHLVVEFSEQSPVWLVC